MTSDLAEANGSDSAYSEHLAEAFRNASAMAAAARQCAANYRWMLLNEHDHLRPVHLLDFDLICGALKTVRLAKWANSNERRIPEAASTLIGPHEIRHLLSRLKDFSLPPGAQTELLTWLERIKGTLTENGHRILTRFQEARSASDPFAVIVGDVATRDVRRVVQDELENFAASSSDLSLMESILENSEPIEDLKIIPDENLDDFEFAISYLSRKRPDIPEVNNFFDAINVTLVACIYKHSAKSRDGWLPLLISQTRSVVELARSQNTMHLPEERDLCLFNEREYLVIASELTRISGDQPRIIINESEVLAQEADALAILYADLADAVRRESTLPAGEYCSLPEWELLQVQLESFGEHWKEVFSPTISARNIDNIEYQNTLFSAEIKTIVESLGTSSAEDLRNGIRHLHRQLLVKWYGNAALRDLLFTNELTSPLDKKPPSPFSFSILDEDQHDGRPLRICKEGRSLEGWTSKRIPWLHDVRLVAHSSYLRAAGARLAVDSRRTVDTTFNHWLQITWPHDKNIVEVSKVGRELLSNSFVNGETPCDVTLFTSSGENKLKAKVNDLEQVVIRAATDVEGVDYLEVTAEECTFFADGLPLEATEFQAGVLMPAHIWTDDYTQQISSAILDSSELEVAKKKQYAGAIVYLMSLVRSN